MLMRKLDYRVAWRDTVPGIVDFAFGPYRYIYIYYIESEQGEVDIFTQI